MKLFIAVAVFCVSLSAHSQGLRNQTKKVLELIDLVGTSNYEFPLSPEFGYEMKISVAKNTFGGTTGVSIDEVKYANAERILDWTRAAVSMCQRELDEVVDKVRSITRNYEITKDCTPESAAWTKKKFKTLGDKWIFLIKTNFEVYLFER